MRVLFKINVTNKKISYTKTNKMEQNCPTLYRIRRRKTLIYYFEWSILDKAKKPYPPASSNHMFWFSKNCISFSKLYLFNKCTELLYKNKPETKYYPSNNQDNSTMATLLNCIISCSKYSTTSSLSFELELEFV